MIKKRRPWLAALLSFLSPGLGQLYSGDPAAGIALGLAPCLAGILYAARVYTDGSKDPLFFWAATGLIALAVIYSIFRAFRRARAAGPSYTLKKYNRIYVYLAFAVIALALFIVPGRIIQDRALADIAPWHPFRTETAKVEYTRLYDEASKMWPVASENRIVETSWGRTFVRISGPAEGPPLVLLHGAGATSLMWAPNIEALSTTYRTFAPDNIYDMGMSVFTRRLKKPDDFVGWLDELFAALKLEDHINLVGQSYGGWIAGHYLIRRPERLDTVVMLAPAMTVVPFQWGFFEHGLLSTLPFRRFSRDMMYWLLADLAKKDEAGRRLVEMYVDELYGAQRCFKPKELVPPTLLSDRELESIMVPTLFMVGEHEKIFSPEKALERLKRVAPRIRTELVPGAGHDLTLVQADLVNARILEFLKDNAWQFLLSRDAGPAKQ